MSSLWEFQYKRQFEWLKETREFLYKKINIGIHKRVLELGCSSGLIIEELLRKLGGMVVGLDKDLDVLLNAKRREKDLSLVCGDVYFLPFRREIFDSVIFQFFLLWLRDTFSAIKEMKRVLIQTGCVLSIAEPDYGGRIDFPHTLNYSSFIIKKLTEEGADPFIGRKLEYLFKKSSLDKIQWGLTSIPFGIKLAEKNFTEEWNFIEKLSKSEIGEELKEIRENEVKFINEGKRAYFMPVFYCTGKKGSIEK